MILSVIKILIYTLFVLLHPEWSKKKIFQNAQIRKSFQMWIAIKALVLQPFEFQVDVSYVQSILPSFTHFCITWNEVFTTIPFTYTCTGRIFYSCQLISIANAVDCSAKVITFEIATKFYSSVSIEQKKYKIAWNEMITKFCYFFCVYRLIKSQCENFFLPSGFGNWNSSADWKITFFLRRVKNSVSVIKRSERI